MHYLAYALHLLVQPESWAAFQQYDWQQNRLSESLVQCRESPLRHQMQSEQLEQYQPSAQYPTWVPWGQ